VSHDSEREIKRGGERESEKTRERGTQHPSSPGPFISPPLTLSPTHTHVHTDTHSHKHTHREIEIKRERSPPPPSAMLQEGG